MTKEELLKSIDEMIRNEETLVPIYLSHIDRVMQWSGMNDADRKSAAEILTVLAEDSKVHSAHFQKLRSKILEDRTDVY